MSKNTQMKDWDKLWAEFNTSLKSWMNSFESLQKANNVVQAKYNDVMAKAMKESSDKTLNQFTENWQKTMNQAGMNAFKQFGENWQKMMTQSGMDQLKTYGEMMNKFAETWQKMWNK